MQSELNRNNICQSVELLLLVPMLFLLAIPKCLLIFKENFYYTSLIRSHSAYLCKNLIFAEGCITFDFYYQLPQVHFLASSCSVQCL